MLILTVRGGCRLSGSLEVGTNIDANVACLDICQPAAIIYCFELTTIVS